jgi:hypothetical protein
MRIILVVLQPVLFGPPKAEVTNPFGPRGSGTPLGPPRKSRPFKRVGEPVDASGTWTSSGWLLAERTPREKFPVGPSTLRGLGRAFGFGFIVGLKLVELSLELVGNLAHRDRHAYHQIQVAKVPQA